MIIRVESELPVPAEVVAALIRKPALLRYLTWPILTMPDMPDGEFASGHEMTTRLYLVGVIPLWRHTVRVVGADPPQTEERGGPLRSWRHRLVVTPLSAGRCRYADEVEIDSGPLTLPAAVLARVFYRHRHRRWAALARVLGSVAEIRLSGLQSTVETLPAGSRRNCCGTGPCTATA